MELRCALIGSGQHAKPAKHLVEEHDASGRGGLDVELFVRAWHAEARRYSCRTWRKLGLLGSGAHASNMASTVINGPSHDEYVAGVTLTITL